MKRPIVAVDVDDVLSPTNLMMMHFVNSNFGTAHTWEEYTAEGDYDGYWGRVWNVSREEAERRYKSFVTAEVLREVEPMEDAIQTLAYLKKQFELVIVTARGDDRAEDTHHWLEKRFPQVFKGVHFLPVWGDGKKATKAAICKEIGAGYLVDDNVEHCVLAAQEGIHALLFGDYGWNKHATLPSGVVRVKDWRAVREYFDGRDS